MLRQKYQSTSTCRTSTWANTFWWWTTCCCKPFICAFTPTSALHNHWMYWSTSKFVYDFQMHFSKQQATFCFMQFHFEQSGVRGVPSHFTLCKYVFYVFSGRTWNMHRVHALWKYNNCIGSEPQRCGSGTDTVERTATACTDPQRFKMELAEGQRRLPNCTVCPRRRTGGCIMSGSPTDSRQKF